MLLPSTRLHTASSYSHSPVAIVRGKAAAAAAVVASLRRYGAVEREKTSTLNNRICDRVAVSHRMRMPRDFIAQCLYGFLIYYRVNPPSTMKPVRDIRYPTRLYSYPSSSSLFPTQSIITSRIELTGPLLSERFHTPSHHQITLRVTSRGSILSKQLHLYLVYCTLYLLLVFCSSCSCRSRLSLTSLSLSTSILSSAEK